MSGFGNTGVGEIMRRAKRVTTGVILAGAAALALTVSGCTSASFGPLLETVGVDPTQVHAIEDSVLKNAVARPINVYGNAPLTARESLRGRINALPEMNGAQIGIWYPGDPEITLGDSAAPETAPVPPTN